jgi:outer membrane protein assembly factor BamB
MSPISLVLALSLAAPAPKDSAAGDWPQWRGPNRDGHSASTGLLQKWPDGGPKLVFKTDKIGAGYGSPAVVGGKLFIMGSENTSKEKPDGETSVVLCLEPLTGKEIWKTPIGEIKPVQDKNRGSAPRATPTVDSEHLYVVDAQGEVACLNVADGKKIWSKSMVKDLGGAVPTWGYSESVLIDGDKLICTPGGGKGAVAALDKKNGNILWQSAGITDGACYSSAIRAEVAGVPQYIQQSMKGTFGVSAKDGKKLWHVENKAYKVAVVPTPVFYNDHVFATAGYSAGCKLIKLVKNGDGIKAEEVYSAKLVSNHHGGIVRVGEYLYGHTEKEWVCLKFLSPAPKEGEEPKPEWTSTKQEKGSVSYADGCLYTYGQLKGEVVLVKADPSDWKELGRFTIPDKSQIRRAYSNGGIWAHPVIANGKLYLREYEWLFCYDVAAKE